MLLSTGRFWRSVVERLNAWNAVSCSRIAVVAMLSVVVGFGSITHDLVDALALSAAPRKAGCPIFFSFDQRTRRVIKAIFSAEQGGSSNCFVS